MFCEYCGKYIHEGAPFCPYCGTVVVKKKEETKKEKRKRLKEEAEMPMDMQQMQSMQPMYAMPMQNENNGKKGKKAGIFFLLLSFATVMVAFILLVLSIADGYGYIETVRYTTGMYYYMTIDGELATLALVFSGASAFIGGMGLTASYNCRKKCSWLMVAHAMNLLFVIAMFIVTGILI